MTFRLVRRPASDAASIDLDPEQAAVVAHVAGPLLVAGAPGTGKTTILVEAVAARVAQGVAPERILVLTFGRRAAGQLRARIEGRISAAGRATAEPLVRTFHAYAFGLLRRAAAERGEPPPRLLTGPEQDLVIRELLAAAVENGATEDWAGEGRRAAEDRGVGEGAAAGAPLVGGAGRAPRPAGRRTPWPAGLAPALRTRAFAGQLRDLLLRAAERGIDAGALERLGAETGRPEWTAAAAFLHEYEQVLALRDVTGRAGVAYDNAELVRAAAGLLTDDPALLAAERQRLSCVYVDELADTDPAQMDLLELIAGGGGHLVAFADPDSSTYAFRGADPSAVATFADRFRRVDGRPAPRIVLRTPHRFGPELLASTGRVAAKLRGPAWHRLQVAEAPAAREVAGARPPAVEVHTFRAATSEAAYVAHRLREAHLLDGVAWDRMAVVVRSTTLALATLRRALTQAGVPVTTYPEELPLHAQPAVAPLLLALACALRPERLDEPAAVALLHSPLGGADPLAERRLRQGLRALALAAGDRRPSGVLLVEALREPAELAALQRRWAEPAARVARLLAIAREADAALGSTAEDTLWALWQASGLVERWAAASARGGHRGEVADRDLDAVMVLFDAAARFADRLPGARTEVFLEFVQGQELPADSLARLADRGAAVRVLTAHAAKGREWEVVVVAGVQEGIWPDLRLRGSVLGSEQLVDILAGRAGPGGPGAVAGAAGQIAALLDEERRLFYVATTRARRRLLVTAVDSGDREEQPSRFLAELTGLDPDARQAGARQTDAERSGAGQGRISPDAPETAVTRLPRALTLPALVAELRVAVTDPNTPPARRDAAAAALAKLDRAGIPGAGPDQWWGLPPLSDERPLRDGVEPVTVTPSTVESVQRCSLRWLLERHGGAAARSPEQSVGNLVHEVAMAATGPEVERATLVSYLAEEFDKIEMSARWMAGRERRRAEEMLDKLMGWLAANPRRVVGIERDFLVQLDETIRIKGRVDRLEVDDQGRPVVIDLKTGKTTSATDAEIVQQPQLGAYQAAVAAGGFPEIGDEPGGAALVQLGTGHAAAKEQWQPPLAHSPDPAWAQALVRRTAATMAASTFHAVANAKCRACPVRTACPVSGKGRQVTGGEGGKS
jgi:superfamily I DNA/RNA helicase/RecB family exonuclease